MDLKNLKVAVVGAGIGGLAAACALAQRGAGVTVYEQAPQLREVGAGLQVSVNGQRVLYALGVDTGATGSASPGTEFYDGVSGRRVATIAPPKDGPTIYIHRADLLGALEKLARAFGVEIVLDRLVTPHTITADVTVAADGVRSVWRSEVDGPAAPTFTRQVAWRALVPWQGRAVEPARLTMGHRAHIVNYPLRGGTLMNLVAVEERGDWREEGWSISGDPDAFKARFADFGGPVADAVERVEKVFQWALHARPVAQNWAKGGTVLLGDAAHPTLPFMAQGACLSLEDAWVLAACLDRAKDVATAMSEYEEARRARAARVVALARGNAWRFHMGRPFAWGAHVALGLGAGLLARRLEWVYDYDAPRLFPKSAR